MGLGKICYSSMSENLGHARNKSSIGEEQAETVSDVLLEEGYKKIESLKDISQIDRFVVATL